MAVDALLDNLTEPQREAVLHQDGPLLVLAGAGSGKTRVITRRAAYLADTVTDPFHILAITFTNKAAEEMRHRIENLQTAGGMTVSTFHSLCARLLRIHAKEVGIEPNFTIFDQSDRKQVVKNAIRACELSDRNWSPERIAARISLAKNDNLSPEEYARVKGDDFESKIFTRIYLAYEEMLREQNGLDFDDLLIRAAAMLRGNETLRARLEDRYRYVLIDEYQDTNLVQYEIARHLTREEQNLCATGDPDQSIYGWRGANLDNILKFEDDFPGAKVVRLEQNYRSTKAILRAASALIAANRRRKKKDLWTENHEGNPVRVVETPRADAEADFIAHEILEQMGSGRPASDIAVLYRINSLSRVIEDALRRAGIPYQIVRGVAFYNRREIKDVVAYLRLMINPADDTALLRVINTPARGIGKTTVDRLRSAAAEKRASLWETVRGASDLTTIGAAPKGRLKTFVDLIESLQPMVACAAREVVEPLLVRSGLMAALEKEGDREKSALANVKELISAAADFDEQHPDGDVIDWLQEISLVSDVDVMDPEAGAVTLMTLHAAKGLEFPVVYIVAFEEGLLPMKRRDEQPSNRQIEEERRLCFVGMTRAMQSLTFTRAQQRMIMGQTLRTSPSPLEAHLPTDVERLTANDSGRIEQHRPARRPRTAPARANLDSVLSKWPKGSRVRHASFGLGRIEWIVPAPKQTRISVDFEEHGSRTFILEYADLERVEDDVPF